MKFSPSLMCMDFLDMRNQLEIMDSRAYSLHVDIMDGHYVKNITLSPDFVKAIRPATSLPLECHLMTTNPEDFIPMLLDAGADLVSPQAETINAQAFRLINLVKARGKKFGVTINPSTPLSYIKPYIHLLDKITIMTVDPGFAGQPFIAEMLDKIREAKELKEENGYKYLIEVDGSCNERTFKILSEAGAEILIVGSSGLFGLDKDLVKAWDKMEETYKTAMGN